MIESGAVAQLGERELCKLEVVGSIPIGSTNLSARMRGMSERRKTTTASKTILAPLRGHASSQDL